MKQRYIIDFNCHFRRRIWYFYRWRFIWCVGTRTPPWPWRVKNIPDWLVQGKQLPLVACSIVNHRKLQTVYTVYQSSPFVVRHIRDLILPSKRSIRDVCLMLSVYTFASFTCLKRSPERGSCCHASFGGHAEFFWFWFWVLCLEWPQISFSFDTPLYCCDIHDISF